MRIKWISHRGESADAPENTAAAFVLARDRGTDGSECDVHFSADRKLMAAHDCDTGRMGDRQAVIEEEPAARLRTINVAGHHRDTHPTAMIPFLAEILPLTGPGRQLYIELKHDDPHLAEAVKHQTEAAGLTGDRRVIISFHAAVCAYAKQLMPDSKVLWLNNDPTLPAAELIAELRKRRLDGVDAGPNAAYLTPEGIAELHAAGLTAAAWTVDDAAAAKKLIAAGIDAITSNRAAALSKEV